ERDPKISILAGIRAAEAHAGDGQLSGAERQLCDDSRAAGWLVGVGLHAIMEDEPELPGGAEDGLAVDQGGGLTHTARVEVGGMGWPWKGDHRGHHEEQNVSRVHDRPLRATRVPLAKRPNSLAAE